MLKYLCPLKTAAIAITLLLTLPITASSNTLLTKQIEVNGATLHYLEMGQGPVMIFIHGWSANAQYWQPQLEYFAQHYRVIAYDWRGMGQSTGGDKAYPFTQLVDDLNAFIIQLNITKPILVGHSLGGVTALHFAAKHPSKAGAIIAVDAPGDGNWITGKLSHISSKALSFVSDKRVLAWQLPINQYFFYSDDFIQQQPNKILAWRKQFLSNSRTALEHAFKAMAYRTPLPTVNTDVSVLLVQGEQDRFISLTQSRQYQQKFSHAELKILPGAGHMSTEEKPELFNIMLRDFLNQSL